MNFAIHREKFLASLQNASTLTKSGLKNQRNEIVLKLEDNNLYIYSDYFCNNSYLQTFYYNSLIVQLYGDMYENTYSLTKKDLLNVVKALKELCNVFVTIKFSDNEFKILSKQWDVLRTITLDRKNSIFTSHSYNLYALKNNTLINIRHTISEHKEMVEFDSRVFKQELKQIENIYKRNDWNKGGLQYINCNTEFVQVATSNYDFVIYKDSVFQKILRKHIEYNNINLSDDEIQTIRILWCDNVKQLLHYTFGPKVKTLTSLYTLLLKTGTNEYCMVKMDMFHTYKANQTLNPFNGQHWADQFVINVKELYSRKYDFSSNFTLSKREMTTERKKEFIIHSLLNPNVENVKSNKISIYNYSIPDLLKAAQQNFPNKEILYYNVSFFNNDTYTYLSDDEGKIIVKKSQFEYFKYGK